MPSCTDSPCSQTNSGEHFFYHTTCLDCCKNVWPSYSILFLVSDLPLFLSLKSIFPSSTQLFSHEGTGFLLRTDFFLPPSILPIYPFPFFYLPLPIQKRSLKALLHISQPQTRPSRKKKGIKAIETPRNNTQIPLLAAAK